MFTLVAPEKSQLVKKILYLSQHIVFVKYNDITLTNSNNCVTIQKKFFHFSYFHSYICNVKKNSMHFSNFSFLLRGQSAFPDKKGWMKM